METQDTENVYIRYVGASIAIKFSSCVYCTTYVPMSLRTEPQRDVSYTSTYSVAKYINYYVIHTEEGK